MIVKNKKTIIFVGISGCGKGTQADLVEKVFKDRGEKVTHIELGSEFRDFLSMTTDTANRAQSISKKGGLQPEFLAIHL
jgi:adenylate kinase family enzyme